MIPYTFELADPFPDSRQATQAANEAGTPGMLDNPPPPPDGVLED
jgi:hypothetical protein